MHLHTQRLDARTQRRTAFGIQLHRHQAWGELHHMGFQAQRLQRIGCFQTEQPAADHHAPSGLHRRLTDRIQILQRAVDQPGRAPGTFDGRNKGIGTGRQYQLVISSTALRGDHLPPLTIDFQHRRAQVQLHARLLVQLRRSQRQRLGITTGKILGQVNPVVGPLALLGEHLDIMAIQRPQLDQLLHTMVTDHTVADNHYCPAL